MDFRTSGFPTRVPMQVRATNPVGIWAAFITFIVTCRLVQVFLRVKMANKSWGDQDTRILVSFWAMEEVQHKLNSSHRNIVVYGDASDKLAECGYKWSAHQCQTRIKTLKKLYKQAKSANLKSGNQKHTSPCYDLIDQVLGDRPATTPAVHISSLAASVSGQQAEPVVLSSGSDGSDAPHSIGSSDSDLVVGDAHAAVGAKKKLVREMSSPPRKKRCLQAKTGGQVVGVESSPKQLHMRSRSSQGSSTPKSKEEVFIIKTRAQLAGQKKVTSQALPKGRKKKKTAQVVENTEQHSDGAVRTEKVKDTADARQNKPSTSESRDSGDGNAAAGNIPGKDIHSELFVECTPGTSQGISGAKPHEENNEVFSDMNLMPLLSDISSDEASSPVFHKAKDTSVVQEEEDLPDIKRTSRPKVKGRTKRPKEQDRDPSMESVESNSSTGTTRGSDKPSVQRKPKSNSAKSSSNAMSSAIEAIHDMHKESQAAFIAFENRLVELEQQRLRFQHEAELKRQEQEAKTQMRFIELLAGFDKSRSADFSQMDRYRMLPSIPVSQQQSMHPLVPQQPGSHPRSHSAQPSAALGRPPNLPPDSHSEMSSSAMRGSCIGQDYNEMATYRAQVLSGPLTPGSSVGQVAVDMDLSCDGASTSEVIGGGLRAQFSSM